jgi:ectoine hydroxylase-related dioxygenase (phytanoyl-CoA dioxygenase family)
MDSGTRDAHLAGLRTNGYTIVENAIEPALIDELAERLTRLEKELDARPAANSFEGRHTVRVYNLLEFGAPFDALPVHPEILPLVEAILEPDCLLSSISSIAIEPGERAQPIHTDDMPIPIAKPRPPIVCNSLWALTDFTEENGATRLVPRTHLEQNPKYGGDYETIAATMPRGSVLVWDGALYHGGGANRTSSRRVGIAVNYCAGFLRQEENLQLGLVPELVASFPARLQELIGYGIYRLGIGHIHRKSPAEMRELGGGAFRSLKSRGRGAD